MKVTRQQVLAYRIAEHGLHRAARDESELALFDLGVQDTSNATARLALAARLPRPAGDLAGFTLIWSYRGAPHLHRGADLPALAEALWPGSESDAWARLAWRADRGIPALEAYAVTARALREAVPRTMGKGAASAALTAAIPPGLSQWCRGCQATHVSEQLMRLAVLPAGIRLETDRYPATLSPIEPWPGIPERTRGVDRVITTYLRFFGPATPGEVAGFLGTTRKSVLPYWPDDLSEVDVEGRTCWLPEDRLDLLRDPPAPPPVRLLPALDPYLQARDRDLLVPDKAAQKALWRILGNPGALLVDGEVAGVWRARTARTRIEITVQPFAPLDPETRAEVEAEATTIGAVRGAGSVAVRFATG
ncbi:DNA glycosylase AlkZ-like family protein [Gandjariella thermophila]|uniref:Winged helix DNA-binding domain-containing protein n=1 Tax=Gandjariella thermophila TaxID=1931992 RepID=A0A4D4JEI5_9PSEU|nr:crosslink repair DNA glycosylase YcaQ family protein [Gandjariella thermophila]GDY32263.1 hypothetical protein GTS_38960 [Gandjariella thermophila]